MPSSATTRAVVWFQAQVGGRKKRGRWPIVASMISCVRSICARWPAKLSFVMFGCVQVWLPTTMPASRSSRTMPGDSLTLLADHEERGARVQRLQLVQDLRRVRAGAVVERQRHAALAVGRRDALRPSCRGPPRTGPSPCDRGRLLDACAAGARRAAGAGLPVCPPAASRCRSGGCAAAGFAVRRRRRRRGPTTIAAATSSTAAAASSRRRA